jgi:glycine oxidase
VGEAGPDGLLLATGHYRNGILMSPVTADAIVARLAGQAAAPEWEPFAPGRFDAGTAESGTAESGPAESGPAESGTAEGAR